MTGELRTLVRISVYAACGESNALRRIGRSASLGRIPRRKIVEALLQVHLFAGFPATIKGFSILAPYLEKTRHSKSDGQGLSRSRKKSLGFELFQRVYKGNAREVINNLGKLHPSLSTWILGHGYGTVLSRRGMSLQEREVCAIAVLASLGWTTQLKSHLRGAVNLGVRSVVIKEAYKIGSQKAFQGQKGGLVNAELNTLGKEKA